MPALVLLDWMVLGPPPGFLDALAGLQDATAWQDVRAGLFRMWTCGVDVRAVHSYVDSMTRYGADRWGRAGREIAASFRQEGSPAAALSKLDPPAPVLHLYAQPADEAVLQAQQAFARANPWFFVERLAARSHFPMLEVPGHMAETLDRFLFAHT